MAEKVTRKINIRFPQKNFFVRLFKEKVYLVGGTVRDYFLEGHINKQKDIDLMVIDHTYEQIEEKLKPYGKTNSVGKSFAVIKFCRQRQTFDISVPRMDFRQHQNSSGHKNFIIDSGPHISLVEDLQRRDFTCNSIAYRLDDQAIVDPFNGVQAIRQKHLLMTGPATFFDDPLRLLRAARFSSVLRFSIDRSIYQKAREVNLNEISQERITDELCRLLLESDQPGKGLEEYFKLSILEKLFPQLYQMTLTIQDAVFHPERDEFGHHTVWIHTLITVDVAKKISLKYQLTAEEILALLLACLFHDVGKIVTSRWEYKRGRMTITSVLHDTRGFEIVLHVLTQLKIETLRGFPLKNVILDLIRNHHRLFDYYRNQDKISFKSMSRLLNDMEGRDLLLVLLDFADRQSRQPHPLDFDDVDEISQWYWRKKEELKLGQEKIKPLILGRDLIKLGFSPGKKLGDFLKKLYEWQLDGEFSTREEGFELIKKKGWPKKTVKERD